MAKLILSMDNLALKEIPLDKERITIGRKPQNDIQIDNLAISDNHAVIVTILNDTFLEDLNSTNGTFVNGRLIHKHFLQDGDVIELGKYRLKYIKEAGPSLAQEDYEKTMALGPEMRRKPSAPATAATPAAASPALRPAVEPPRPSIPPSPQVTPSPTLTAAPAAPAASAAAQPAPLPVGAIQVLTGSNAGKSLDLVKSLTTLGKPGVQVAVIARRPHGYFLAHVEGARYPSVNGIPISNQAHPLKDHDIIELAGVKMEFFMKE
jgi:pSer/pThr/pTyr-binding forkhead associated (FHA) protein